MADEKEHLSELVKKRRKEGWIEAQFFIEAAGIEQPLVESSLKEHVERLGKAKDILVYDATFSEAAEMEKIPQALAQRMPPGGRIWSQVSTVNLFAKSLDTLVYIVMVYGPSAVEILSPHKKEINVEEMQGIVNVVAGVLHEFAAAGMGGLVMSAPKAQAEKRAEETKHDG